MKMGPVDMDRIRAHCVGDHQLHYPDWSHQANGPYRAALTNLIAAMHAAFPLDFDTSEVTACKQPNKPVDEFLHRFMVTYRNHGGMMEPGDRTRQTP